MESNKLEQAVYSFEEKRDKVEIKWLTFWLDEQLFGVSITNVEQIVSMQPVTEMPEYPAYAKGVINLRGSIIPVIDLRSRLGKIEIQYTDHTCIIISRVDSEQLGFIVDEVDAVIDIPDDVISLPPKMGDDGVNRYLTGIARISEDGMKEKIVLCLNSAKVLLDDEQRCLTM